MQIDVPNAWKYAPAMIGKTAITWSLQGMEKLLKFLIWCGGQMCLKVGDMSREGAEKLPP